MAPVSRAHGGGVYFEPPRGRNFIRPPSFIRPRPLEGSFQGWGGGCVQTLAPHWWTFRIFLIFFLLGEGEGGVRGAGRWGGVAFFRKSQERGGGGAEGPVSAANWGIGGGGGGKDFFGGPKCPSRRRLSLSVRFSSHNFVQEFQPALG